MNGIYYESPYIMDMKSNEIKLRNHIIIFLTCIIVLMFIWAVWHGINIKNERQGYKQEIAYKDSLYASMKKSEIIKFDIPVTITTYYPTIKQCDSTPLITADGSKIDTNNFQQWCAISPDLMYYFNMGDTILIESKGEMFPCYYIIHDVTSNRLRRMVDILNSKYLKFKGKIIGLKRK